MAMAENHHPTSMISKTRRSQFIKLSDLMILHRCTGEQPLESCWQFIPWGDHCIVCFSFQYARDLSWSSFLLLANEPKWKLGRFPKGYTLYVHLNGEMSNKLNARRDYYLYGRIPFVLFINEITKILNYYFHRICNLEGALLSIPIWICLSCGVVDERHAYKAKPSSRLSMHILQWSQTIGSNQNA